MDEKDWNECVNRLLNASPKTNNAVNIYTNECTGKQTLEITRKNENPFAVAMGLSWKDTFQILLGIRAVLDGKQ